MKNIRLTTPEQIENGDTAVELDPNNLENWLNSLLNSDIIETVTSLDKTLSAFNSVKIPAIKRKKLLEIYFATFQKLLHSYDEMRIAQLNIPTKQKHQLRNDIVWLYIKLSHGYKIIVKDELESNNSPLKQQDLLLTTFRAIELTVISLLYAYRYGLDAPPLVFLELHQLYTFAEFKKITKKSVKAAKGYAKTPTISNFYSLAMLFTSIDPTKYEAYTLEVLFLALQSFLFNCQISHSPKPKDDSLIYKINIFEDAAPVIIPNGQLIEAILEPSESTIYLDITNFIGEVSSWLESNKNNKNTFLIEDELELFPGVLKQLNELKEKSTSSTPESTNKTKEPSSVRLIFGLQPLESLLIVQTIDLDLKLDYKSFEWDVVSQTKGSFELSCRLNNSNESLTLGDLVSIIDLDEEGKLTSLKHLTYISSIKQLDNDTLSMRLEIIDGTPQATTYTAINENPATEDSLQQNGILLTSQEDDKNSQVLLVKRSLLNHSKQYLLKTQSSCLKTTITIIKNTPCYSFLEINEIEDLSNELASCNITKLAS